RVRENAGRSGDIAEHRLGSGHGLGGGQVIGERRVEERLRGVLANLFGVLLIHRLSSVAPRLQGDAGTGLGQEGKREQRRGETPESLHASDYNLIGGPWVAPAFSNFDPFASVARRAPGEKRVLHRFGGTTNGQHIPRGKPWDRQPVSSKLRRKLGVSPGVAAHFGAPPP